MTMLLLLGGAGSVSVVDVPGFAHTEEVQLYAALIEEIPHMAEEDESQLYDAQLKEDR